MIENKWLIAIIVQKFRFKGSDKSLYEDLSAAGQFGLLEAAQKFDCEKISELTGRPTKFSSYAYFYVYKHVSNAFKERIEFVRTPMSNKGKYNF